MKKLFAILCLLSAVLRLSATTPVPYTEAVDFSFRISGGGSAMLTFYDESAVIPGVGMSYAPLPTTESEVGRAWLRPGKSYYLNFGWSNPWEYTFSLTAPDGYQIYIDGQPTDIIRRYTGGGEGGHSYQVRLMPSNIQGPAEFASFSGIQLGKSVTWSVGLGGLQDTGRSAGRLMFKEKDLATVPASRARLYYAVPANYGSVVALYDDPATKTVLRQLLLPQGGIDLVDDASGGYWMKFYTKENSWYDSVAWQYAQFQGTPWKTIRVQSPAANQLKITETEGAVTRVSLLELTSGSVPSGTYVWTLREGDAATWLRTTTHVSTATGTVASGGAVTTSGNYTVHTFASNGTFSLNTALTGVDAVIVAGGGGGGMQHAGGGGAGGLLAPSGLSLSAGSYPITVGAGGAGAITYPSTGINGGNSAAFNYTAFGGGAGTGMDQSGNSGGSGGGNGWPSGGVGGGEGTPGQGNRGSRGPSTSVFNGGGGGGAGGPGNGISGGAAAATWAGTFAGGGGGGFAGGSGGGAGAGAGGLAAARGGDAASNTGSGGGGGGNYGALGGNGGSGIVVVRYPTRRDSIVTVRTGDTNGPVVSKTKYQFCSFAWGEELLAVEADPDGAKLKTSYDYYTDSNARGHYRKVKSTTDATGNWVAFQYYDNWDKRGNVFREFHPYLDAPATVSFDATKGRVVEYDYAADWTGRFNRLVLRQETTNNIVTGRTTRLNNDVVGQSWPRETATTTSYRDSNVANALVQYAEWMRGDAGNVEPGRPYVARGADSVQTSWSRDIGTYDAATGTFTTQGSNSHFRELVVHGSSASTGAESQTSWSGQNFSQIYLVPNKSTMDATIYDSRGLLIRTESWVYTGSGAFSLMTYENLSYDSIGRLIGRVSNGNTVLTNTYTNGQLTSTVDAAGVETTFTYDGLGRVKTATKKGAPAATAVLTAGYSYPAQGDITTTSTYDGMGRVVSTVVTGGSLSQTASSVYDLAGRVTTSTAPGNFTTSYAYSPATRTVTVTVPGGGTKIATTYLDGQPFTISGTAAVSEYVTYWVDADGRKACQRTLGGFAAAWTNICWDWLGRQVEAWRPGWDGNNWGTFWDYNNQGQLYRLRQPGLANTLYAYDTLGQLSAQWLDVNGNGLLDAAGTDRITVPGWSFSYDGSGWFLNQTQSVYTQDNAATAVQVSKVSQKLAGMAANRLARTDSTDIYGNTSIAFTDVDRANKKATSWAQLSDATNTPQTITYNGLTVESRDKAGVVMRFEYDSLGRPTKTIDPRTGATVTTYKADSSLVDKVTDPSNVVQRAYTYDAAGRVATATDAFSKVQRFNYNTLGQVTQQWGANASPIENVYDPLGRVVTLKTYRGGTGWDAATWPTNTGTADLTTWTYHAATGFLQSKQDATGKKVDYTYTPAGQLLTRTWARGAKTTYAYSAITGEMTGVTYSDGTPASSYTYNRLGQLATVADVTGTRTFTFNLGGTLELQNEQLPAYFNSRRLTYGYDTATGVKGRLNAFSVGTAAAPAADQSVAYAYSTADARLSTITALSAGNTSYAYTYDYTANSHLVAKVSQATVGYSDVRVYDPQHPWVDSRTTSYGAAVKAAFAYTQDNLGRVTQVTKTGEMFSRYGATAAGLATSYGYNDRSELTAEATNIAGTTDALPGRSDAYAYDNIGNRTTVTHNGATSTYTPNALNQYTSRTVPGIFDVSGAAAVPAVVTGPNGPAARQGQYFFQGAALNNSTGAAYSSLTFTSSVAGIDGKSSFALAAYVPKATQDYTYDADGNMTDDTRWKYTYDAENRLIGMETATAAIAAGVPRQKFTFTNDYLGRRVEKLQQTWSGTAWVDAKKERFVYRGWELAAVIDAAGTAVRHFFWGLDAAGATGSASGAGGAGGLLMIQEAAQSYLPAYDAMGNVHALIKAADGSIAAAYEYDAYGNLLRESGAYAASNPFRFATKYTDVETGQIYYGLRYYNPVLGRFNNRDPIEERGGNNLYAFGHNSPSTRWDVLGLSDPTESGGSFWSRVWSSITSIFSGSSSSQSGGRDWVGSVSGANYTTNAGGSITRHDKSGDYTFSANENGGLNCDYQGADGSSLSAVVSGSNSSLVNNYLSSGSIGSVSSGAHLQEPGSTTSHVVGETADGTLILSDFVVTPARRDPNAGLISDYYGPGGEDGFGGNRGGGAPPVAETPSAPNTPTTANTAPNSEVLGPGASGAGASTTTTVASGSGKGVQLNLFSPSVTQYSGAAAIPRIPGVYQIAGEGSPKLMFDAKNHPITGTALAKLLLGDSKYGYERGMPVTLYSCNTGQPNGFAQDLANGLGVRVTAPDNFIWFHSDGSTVVAPSLYYSPDGMPTKGPNGQWAPDLANPGNMVPFAPNNRFSPTRPRRRRRIRAGSLVYS